MEFFSNFTWAVPHAFSDAVGLCRFEEGDILYDTPKAYEGEWGNAVKHINHYLQVRYPARATIGEKDKSGGIFEKNWSSEVRIDLYKNQEKVSIGQIRTTQGRLYTALWKGDITILEDNPNNPTIPLNARQITKQLKQVEMKALELSIGLPVFVMVRDRTKQASREKFLKVYAKLNKYLSKKSLLLEPMHTGLNNWKNIAPTIDIAFFPVKEINCEQLSTLVKEAVYVPSKNTKKDMFRITTHGEIFT